jgi:hypothetical protein
LGEELYEKLGAMEQQDETPAALPADTEFYPELMKKY